MRKINSFYFGLILIFLLVFSGCATMSGGGLFGGSSKTPEVDRTGTGLSVSFDINEKFLTTRQLDYTLNLENSGLEPVVLTRDNVKLTTNQNEEVFDKTTVDNFYNNLFRGSDSITIYHDQKVTGIVGSLFINNDFFQKKTRDSFDYFLSFKYNYKTVFSNNLQIDFKSNTILSVLDQVSQAAPVQLTKIELSPIDVNNYVIKYYLNDKGQSTDGQRSVAIKNIQIQFRTQTLSNCKGLVFKDNVYKEVGFESLIISQETPEVIIACKVEVSDIDKTNKMITTTSGSFEYEYNIKIKKSLKLPEKSGDQVVWQ